MICSSPLGVVSLYDLMQRYRLDYFAAFLATCQLVSRDCVYMDKLGLPLSRHAEYFPNFSRIIKGLNIAVAQMDGDKSLIAQIEAFSQDIESGKDQRPGIINAGLKPIMLGVEEILHHRLFMFIPDEQAKYYMNIEQFGDSVAMFAGALGDMFETSMCYASGRATACIFHAMRVAEHGLRHIALELGISIGTVEKPLPIEYATWEAVFQKIEEKRVELRKEPKNKGHENKTIAYADFANQCSHLKDLWRNPTMHSRGLYDLPEALGAMNRVASFMKLIAESIYSPAMDVTRVEMMKGLLEMAKEMRA